MDYSALSQLALAALCGALISAGYLLRKIHALEAGMGKKSLSIEQTSKLLIQKNIELFDQNIAQQKLLASKDDFLAIASHQLRTPVAEVKWAAGSLLSQPEGAPVARVDLQTIAASAAKMERLIEDLLRFVSVEQGKSRLAVSPYQPDYLIKEIAARELKDFAAKHSNLSVDCNFGNSITSLHPDSLDMVVSNLIENAFLYTRDGGEIRIRSIEKDGGLTVEVEDNGIGVPAELKDRLFSKFRRGTEAQERNKEGSGLGLYIIKTLVERAGGSVFFRPSPQRGSIFGFNVPSAPPLRTP